MSDEEERPAEADATEPEPEAAAEVEAEAEPELTLEEMVEILTGELAQARAELTYRDADIVNLRRRHTQERGDLIKFGGRALANRLLSVLDNLDRGLRLPWDPGGCAVQTAVGRLATVAVRRSLRRRLGRWYRTIRKHARTRL